MLLKFIGKKRQYAIGLRWAVDSRHGIESIQFNTDLHYGVMLTIPEKINRKLKLVALCDASHNKAVCLSGLLASKYKHLILVHRLSDTIYWVCVIKNNSIWSGMDVLKATAGDYIADYSSVQTVIDIAKAEFTADGIDLRNIALATETASQEYTDFKVIDFPAFVGKIKNTHGYVIHYLQPSKILLRKIIILFLVLVTAGIAIYYVQQQRLVSYLLHQQQMAEEAQQRQAAQEKVNYFSTLHTTLRNQYGAVVITNALRLLDSLPLQSHGWSLTSATYTPQSPRALNLKLSRSSYGTLNSFLYAYTATAENGTIAADNNTGTKMFIVPTLPLAQNNTPISDALLTQSIPKETYRLTSYMQVNTELFSFQPQAATGGDSAYQVHATNFNISGQKLWQLMQLQQALVSFPTLVINSIKFDVANYEMSWTIGGTIYA